MIYANISAARDYRGPLVEDVLVRTASAEAGAIEEGTVTLSFCQALTHPHEGMAGIEVDMDPDNAAALAQSLLNAAAKARRASNG